jgi:hypothetical protein
MSRNATLAADLRRFARPAILGATLAALAGAPAGAQAAATGPIVVPGNPSCADLNPGWAETKVEPVKSGTFDANGLSGTLTVKDLAFDWTASAGVDAVIVKGGDNAHVYSYSPESTGASGLTAPPNANNDDTFGLSHVSLCHDPSGDPPPVPVDPDPKPDPDPDPKPDPEVPTDPKPQVDPKPQDDPQPQPPTPQPSSPQPVVTAASAAPSPAPVRMVAASRRAAPVPASAAMRGPSSCVKRSFTAVVSGKGIRSVTFYANGKKVRAVAAKSGQNRFALTVTPKRGVERIQARVRFVAGARRSAKTLNMTAIRCLQRAARPQFTG